MTLRKNVASCLMAGAVCVSSSLIGSPAWAGEDLDSLSEPGWKMHYDLIFHSDKWHEDDDLEVAVPIKELFRQRADSIGEDDLPYRDPAMFDEPALPPNFEAWWDSMAMEPLNGDSNPTFENPEGLMLRAIENSSQIQVFSDIPIIRETSELEARGLFDPHVYLEGNFTDLNEPVGSTLITGGPDRLLEDEQLAITGIRKRFITGTEVDLSQRLGVLDNNSEFLEPKDQAFTRIALTVTQPLLNGFGIRYNRSFIDVARIDGAVAMSEFKRQTESHLLELIRAYWGLYLERGVLLQRRALVARTAQLMAELEGRGQFDVTASDLRRARSELLARKSDLVRVEGAVRNAEARILALVNDDSLTLNSRFELIPQVAPQLR